MKKCVKCNHSISSHYCEVKSDHDLYGNPTTLTKGQRCKTCRNNSKKKHGGFDPRDECWSCTKKNLDIHKPILDFWGWHK